MMEHTTVEKPSVLIVTMYYWPEPTGIAPLATDLAEHLGNLGWRTTVFTGFPMMPDWSVHEKYRYKLYMRETKANTEIRRSWVYVPKGSRHRTMKTWKRVAFDSSFILTAFPLLLQHRADIIVAIGPPLQTGFASILLKKLWHCPVLYWMQDIVPDAALNVGMMRAGAALEIARRMERAVYRGVDQIGIISDRFKANLSAKGVPPEKQVLLPNWADLSMFDGTPPNKSLRKSLGIQEDEFVIMHAGSMGAKQALENILRAVKQIGRDHKIRLIISGGGNRSDAVKQEAMRLNLESVMFLPPTGNAEYISRLRMADVLLINQAGDIVDSLVPSKLLTYLPSKRPVVAAVNPQSATAEFLQRSGCGLVVDPDNPDALATGIIALKGDVSRRLEMGTLGEAFVRTHFEKRESLKRFTEVLLRMAAGPVDCGV